MKLLLQRTSGPPHLQFIPWNSTTRLYLLFPVRFQNKITNPRHLTWLRLHMLLHILWHFVLHFIARLCTCTCIQRPAGARTSKIVFLSPVWMPVMSYASGAKQFSCHIWLSTVFQHPGDQSAADLFCITKAALQGQIILFSCRLKKGYLCFLSHPEYYNALHSCGTRRNYYYCCYYIEPIESPLQVNTPSVMSHKLHACRKCIKYL